MREAGSYAVHATHRSPLGANAAVGRSAYLPASAIAEIRAVAGNARDARATTAKRPRIALPRAATAEMMLLLGACGRLHRSCSVTAQAAADRRGSGQRPDRDSIRFLGGDSYSPPCRQPP